MGRGMGGNDKDLCLHCLLYTSMPIVSVDNRIADGIPFVTIDQREAMKASVRYALEKPYERVVFVCPAMASGEKENMYVHLSLIHIFRKILR